MKKQNIKSGRYLILKKNGQMMFVKKVSKNMLIEVPDDVEIEDKTLSKLTKEEKEKLK